MTEPFRLLSHEEFQALTTAEKIQYLDRAMDAQKVIYEQIAAHLSQLEAQKPKE